jgi:hypothetical protein
VGAEWVGDGHCGKQPGQEGTNAKYGSTCPDHKIPLPKLFPVTNRKQDSGKKQYVVERLNHGWNDADGEGQHKR